jgi:23S rRNA pseudoU1915 N3-methylase RlmH
MEKRFEKIAKKIDELVAGEKYIAFLDSGGNILYSSLPEESEQIVKKLSTVFSDCDIGDYQIKKLPKSNLLIYMISPLIILALESYEKEGILITVAKRLEENYEDLVDELESKLLRLPSNELAQISSEESGVELVQECSPSKETEKIAESIPSSITQREINRVRLKEPSIETSYVEKVSETVPVNFPILADRSALKKAKGPNELKILQLCDGNHTIEEIGEKLGISKAQVMITMGNYSAKGMIKYISGFKTK